MGNIYSELSNGHAWVDWNGKVYTNRQEYVNAPAEVLDSDLVGLWLATGERTPQNDFERELLAEIEQMKRDGKGIEFPFD